LSLKFNIPLIFYGENQAEYGNAIEENENPRMNEDFFSGENNSYDDIVLSGTPLKEILEKHNFKINDFNPYIPPKKEEIKKLDVQQRFLGYYIKWDPQECYYYASKNTGFKPNSERTEGSYGKYSSIDDKIDPFHYYCTYIKFGIGRATYDTAQEIRNGKIDRAEGLELVKKFDSEFPKKYFKEFLNYISINEEKFFETIDKFRSPHLWEKNEQQKWVIKKIINK
jgi:hypothetical protein